MKERPILFSAPMVRAILEGRKTQTRRVIEPQPDWIRPSVGDDGVAHGYCGSGPANGITCPYGVPGDRLWVRETFLPCTHGEPVAAKNATYVCFCDGSQKFKNGEYYPRDMEPTKAKWPKDAKWNPSIHMPRWASRITLDVVAVRAERLQDISNNDAMAEGCAGERWLDHDGAEGAGYEPWEQFRDLWCNINGPESWDANSWVWVVEFKRLTNG